MLLTHGLASALRNIGENLVAVSKAKFEVVITGEPRRLDSQTENQLLRIGEEALTNAVRHSNATDVRVEFYYDDISMRLVVSDNGHGFAREMHHHTNDSGVGLSNMRERAAQIGGQLEVTSDLNRGTRVTIVVATPNEAASKSTFASAALRTARKILCI
jgi:signal transduction histidine kinase